MNLPDLPENKAAASKWVKTQNAVYDDYVKGMQNWTNLAKKHRITRAEAIKAVEEVHDYVKSTGVFKEMAKERLHEMDYHYNMLIEEGWSTVEELKNDSKHDKVAPALKIIADMEKARQEALTKAGMYDDYEMGDMLAESERKVDAIVKLLKAVIAEFPDTKQMILSGIKDIEDPDRLPEPDVIDGDVL